MTFEACSKALASVIGLLAIVAVAKIYVKAVFFLLSKQAVHLAVQKGLTVGGCGLLHLLVINQLVASMLWYQLVSLVPPPGFVTDVQRMWCALVTYFFRQDLTWDMVDTCWTYPPSGVAAIVREPLLRNPHLHNCVSEWLAEERAVAVGVTRVGDVMGGGVLGWMLLQELAHRTAIEILFLTTATQHLKMMVLGPDTVLQLEGAQVCGGIPSLCTPAQTEFHISPRIPYLPQELVPHNLSYLRNMGSMDFRGVKRQVMYGLLLHTVQLFSFIHRLPMLLIFGHLIWRGAGRLEELLMGLLLGLDKLGINRSKQWAVGAVICADCLSLFHSYVRALVSLEKEHVVSTDILHDFRE
eukprot:g35456.t1